MQNVISINSARHRRTLLSSREFHSAAALQSPVPNLISLLEPILNGIKSGAQGDYRSDIQEFKEILELSRLEIDQLEDMANFLLAVNQQQSEDPSNGC